MAKMEMRGQMGEERAAGAAGVGVIRYLSWLWVWRGSHPTQAATCRPSPGRWWPWGARRPAVSGSAVRRLQPQCAWRSAWPLSCTCFHHRRGWRPLWEQDQMDVNKQNVHFWFSDWWDLRTCTPSTWIFKYKNNFVFKTFKIFLSKRQFKQTI